MSARLTIEEMQKLAAERGGKCLSKNYINALTKLKWQCARGHIWTAKPNDIKNGHWCFKCGRIESGKKRKLSLPEMIRLAKNRGGKCLSAVYVGANSSLRWQCADGHQWKARPGNIKNGSWCPICSLRNTNENICRGILEYMFKKSFPKQRPSWLLNARGKQMELDGYNKKLAVAFEYHGEQHYRYMPFFHGDTNVRFHQQRMDDLFKKNLCEKNGIKLIEIPYKISIQNVPKYIIVQCKKLGIKVPEHKKIDVKKLRLNYGLNNLREMQNLALKNGGECISSIYINNFSKLKWQCTRGHQWEARPADIKNGHWCPMCAGLAPLDISEMRKIALKRGGKCLSAKFVNVRTKLRWQCGVGHQWEALPSNIKKGQWCPVCAGTTPLTIEEMQAIAAAHGGKCLSKKYMNSSAKLRWQCIKRHIWEAKPNSVKNGSWCPVCAGKMLLTLGEMRELAVERGGKCLSMFYKNNRTKLEWQCVEGHRWKATPHDVKSGSWCPICAVKKRRETRKLNKVE